MQRLTSSRPVGSRPSLSTIMGKPSSMAAWRTVLALLLIVNFREMHQTKQAEKRNKALQKDGVKGGTQ